MATVVKVLLFFLSNFIGFNMGPIVYVLTIKYGISDEAPIYIDQISFMSSVMITWAVCAVFSFSSFFLAGMWRILFLTFPILIPLLYAIALIKMSL